MILKHVRAGLWTMVATALIGCAIQFGLVLFDLPILAWFLLLPLLFGPNVIYAAVLRRHWKSGVSRPVWAVITRPITAQEKARLERRNYRVQNMYVSGVRVAPTPSDATAVMYGDLVACMDGPFDTEELAVRHIGSARRVVSLAGQADEVVADLLNMHHRNHSQEERP